ncbi:MULTISPECIES: MAB_1171c family putative transporter [unclassified Streptomyces]|uniref:MAB_1171c family putative transporter n=1 Tax=unclassified Streptomyces TaxID=2593676 RepID=UPI003FD3968C
MPTYIESVGITALWVVAAVRARQGIADREQRPLWFAIVMIALAMSTHLEPVTAALAHVAPNAHSIDMATHLFGAIDAAAVLWFIFGAAGRQRHTTLVFGAAATVMITLLLLDAHAPPHVRNAIAPSTATPSVPDAYWWVFFSFHLAADTTCGLVCWGYGRHDTPRLLRYGLRLFGTGMLLADLLWVLKLAYLQTRSPAIGSLFSPVTGVEALFMAVGVAIPVLAQVHDRWRDGRSYRALAHLWLDLITASPDVILGPGHRFRGMAVPLQLRLYRRVIEIRDTMIVLRNYVTPTALDLARQHATDQAVPEHLSDVHVTACWLTAALQAKHDGMAPQPQIANLAGAGASDLADEISYLLRVAEAYASPAVRSYKKSLARAS